MYLTIPLDVAIQNVKAIWPLSSVDGNDLLPLRTFIRETLRRSRTSCSTLQAALYYLHLHRIELYLPSHNATKLTNSHACRVLQCGRRMFLAALILASKYLRDRNYFAHGWSKISGLSTTEINQNERVFLCAISWKLYISKEAFSQWTSKMGITNMARRERAALGSLPATTLDSSSSPSQHGCGMPPPTPPPSPLLSHQCPHYPHMAAPPGMYELLMGGPIGGSGSARWEESTRVPGAKLDGLAGLSDPHHYQSQSQQHQHYQQLGPLIQAAHRRGTAANASSASSTASPPRMHVAYAPPVGGRGKRPANLTQQHKAKKRR